MIKRLSWVIFVFLDYSPEKVSTNKFRDSGLSAIAKGGFINLIGLFFFLISNFLYQFILVRILSPADVGLFNLSSTIAGLIGLVVLFGIDRAVVRYVAYYWGKKDRERELGAVVSSVRVLLLLVFIVTPLFWIEAENIAIFIFKKPDLAPVLEIFILGAPFVAFTRLLMGVLQGYKQMKPMVLIEQISVPVLRVVGVSVVILAFVQTSKVVSISFLVASIIGCGLAVIIVRRAYVARKGDTKPVPIYSELLRFSWPLFGASLLNRTNTYTETLILGGLSSSEQVGFFTVSFKIAITVTVIFQAVNAILAPFIAEIYAQGDMSKLAYQFKAVTRWGYTLTLPVALLIFLEAVDIMAVLKPEYVAATPILQMLIFSQLVYVVAGPVALILTMTKYMRLNLIDLLATLILSFILDFTLIPRYGAYGAAVAGAISIMFVNTLRLIQVYVLFRFHPYSWSYIKPAIAGGAAALATLGCGLLLQDFSHVWRLVNLSLVLFSTYGLVILLLGQDEADLEILGTLFRDLLGAKK
ncbi:MAG: flippase [Chloroflexi bacterium]|nr:flippase [Chloroflexota bacterium]